MGFALLLILLNCELTVYAATTTVSDSVFDVIIKLLLFSINEPYVVSICLFPFLLYPPVFLFKRTLPVKFYFTGAAAVFTSAPWLAVFDEDLIPKTPEKDLLNFTWRNS